MVAFFLFKILDHACTICFVFANSFGKSFQNPFANSQRYMSKIARSIFQDFEISLLVSNAFALTTTKLPLNEIIPLVFKRVFQIFENTNNFLSLLKTH
jgi:hypothetical protein